MALSNAERQARYRARRKSAGLHRVDTWTDPEAEHKKQQQEEYQTETAKARQKELRKSEIIKHRRRGQVDGIIAVALLMIKKQCPDIARSILKEFYIDRQECSRCCIDKITLERIAPYLEEGYVTGNASVDNLQ
jgi:hypothetical protein